MAKKRKLPADSNKRAKKIVDLLTGDEDTVESDGKNPAAVALGRLGGLKGGKARAAKLTADEKSKIAKKGAAARWKKKE